MKVLSVLKEDLIRKEDKILDSRDFKYFYKIDPNSHDWKHQEDQVIHRIKCLYKYGPFTLIKLSDREIISNIAIVFSETNFWNDTITNKKITEKKSLLHDKSEKEIEELKYKKKLELCFDRIKKRLQKLPSLLRYFNKKYVPPD